ILVTCGVREWYVFLHQGDRDWIERRSRNISGGETRGPSRSCRTSGTRKKSSGNLISFEGCSEIPCQLRLREYRVIRDVLRLYGSQPLIRQKEKGLITQHGPSECPAEKVLVELRRGQLEEIVRVQEGVPIELESVPVIS